jgi:hypothetical protein
VQSINLSLPRPDVSTAAREAKQKQGTFTVDAVVAPAAPRLISDDGTRQESELVTLARNVDGYVRLSSAPVGGLREAQEAGSLPAGDLYVQMTALRRWRAQFDTQLRTWGVVRNTVLHVPERLTDDDVRSAIELGRVLLQTAETSVNAAVTGSNEPSGG